MLENNIELENMYSEFVKIFQNGSIIYDGVEIFHIKHSNHNELAIVDDFVFFDKTNVHVKFNIRTVYFLKKRIVKGRLYIDQEIMLQHPKLYLYNLMDLTEFTVIYSCSNTLNIKELVTKSELETSSSLEHESMPISVFDKFVQEVFEVIRCYCILSQNWNNL